MENVTIAVRNGIAYVVDKSDPSIKVQIINYDVIGLSDEDVDLDSNGNKCIISVE